MSKEKKEEKPIQEARGRRGGGEGEEKERRGEGAELSEKFLYKQFADVIFQIYFT